MIPYLFHRLPGPAWARTLTFAAVAIGIVAVLFVWGFPELSAYLPTNEQTVVDR